MQGMMREVVGGVEMPWPSGQQVGRGADGNLAAGVQLRPSTSWCLWPACRQQVFMHLHSTGAAMAVNAMMACSCSR